MGEEDERGERGAVVALFMTVAWRPFCLSTRLVKLTDEGDAQKPCFNE